MLHEPSVTVQSRVTFVVEAVTVVVAELTLAMLAVPEMTVQVPVEPPELLPAMVNTALLHWVWSAPALPVGAARIIWEAVLDVTDAQPLPLSVMRTRYW